MVGFQNVSEITLNSITQMTNITAPHDLWINVSQIVYGGLLWFILLWVMFIILFFAMQQKRDQILNNAMYSASAMSIIALLSRAVTHSTSGLSLLTDNQLWAFPLLTAVLVGIIWAIKRSNF